MINNLNTYYDRRKYHFQHQHIRLKKIFARLSMARLVSFLLLVASIYVAINTAAWFFVAALVFLVLFVFFIIRSEKIRNKIRVYDQLLALNQQEIDCQNYTFTTYDEGHEFIDPHHPYSSDLDIFGPQSFFQFINRTQTIWGRDQFSEKLTSFTIAPDEIIAKQSAIKELSSRIGLRQKFWAYASFHRMDKHEYEQLKSFLDQSQDVVKSSVFQFFRGVLPMLFLISLVSAAINILAWKYAIILFVINLLINSLYAKTTNLTHSRLEKQNQRFGTILELLALIKKQSFDSAINISLKNLLFSENHDSEKELLKFKKIVNAFDFRLNMILNLPLNGIMLWDLQCLHRLEKWRRAHASQIPGYFQTIGAFDAYFCLANFAFNHPSNIYPSISENAVLQATGIGHPLIHPEQRVNNSLSINQEGQFIIITGANMSGKSTFLRTVGINHLLASNGLPVLATEYSLHPMSLFTSMRTKDSLGENESYFYAELKRLHQLVQMINEGKRPLILLDEILKGTNSADKLKGSIAFLKQLIRNQCTGIIATHDLALTEMEKEFPQHIINKCFEIKIENGEMLFDYKLQDGVTQHMNALLLMKQLNIIDDSSDH